VPRVAPAAARLASSSAARAYIDSFTVLQRLHPPKRDGEEEDLFVFNDTIEGPRAPAVKPGRVTQA
jgi:hypothetical protein